MKDKGFTLIELLAVMVILAIIALIATPVVMKVIGNAKEAALIDSTYGIVKAVEVFYTNELLLNGSYEGTGNNEVDFNSVPVTGTNKIEYKGTQADSLTVKITPDGIITLTAKFDNLLCEYSGNEVNCTPY